MAVFFCFIHRRYKGTKISLRFTNKIPKTCILFATFFIKSEDVINVMNVIKDFEKVGGFLPHIKYKFKFIYYMGIFLPEKLNDIHDI